VPLSRLPHVVGRIRVGEDAVGIERHGRHLPVHHRLHRERRLAAMRDSAVGVFGALALVLWALLFASVTPVRQAYLNGLIASNQRATVLSFDNLLGSSGGVVSQPALGKIADISGYPLSYVVCAAIQACGLPFLAIARRLKAKSDSMAEEPEG